MGRQQGDGHKGTDPRMAKKVTRCLQKVKMDPRTNKKVTRGL